MRAIKVFAHLGCSLRFCPALANSATANRVTSFLGIAYLTVNIVKLASLLVLTSTHNSYFLFMILFCF